MQSGPMMRSRKAQKRYRQDKHGLGSEECPFCALKEHDDHDIYEETPYFYRFDNIFGYDIWDGHIVTDHQMIAPKRHITSISEMTDKEGQDYLRLITWAEANGYNIYARAKNGQTKSVAHAHTHLIKLEEGALVKALLYFNKPHFRLYSRTRRK